MTDHPTTAGATTAPPVRSVGPRGWEDEPVRRRPGGAARRALGVVVLVLLVLALLVAGGTAAQLYRTTVAWEDRADHYLATSLGLGEDLAGARAELEGVRAELDAVRTQLDTAQARIVELADEKARVTDDREVQRQLVDYQERVNEAAGRVALALDQCVQGQNQLIGYLEAAAQYDPAELNQYGLDVQALCQAATDANSALQRELDR